MKQKILLSSLFGVLMVASFALADWHDADFNSDGVVNIIDQGVFTSWYGSDNCTGPINGTNTTGNDWCGGADFNMDGFVDLVDAGVFSGYYGCNENSSQNSSCYD